MVNESYYSSSFTASVATAAEAVEPPEPRRLRRVDFFLVDLPTF